MANFGVGYMVLSNYEGNISKTLRVIHVDVVIGTTSLLTLFFVVPTKENYNLIHGRYWIHGVREFPLTMHQRKNI